MGDFMNPIEQALAEGAAMEIADRLIEAIKDDRKKHGEYTILTAMEWLLVDLMGDVDEVEHFPILSSLLHNTALKLYDKENSNG